MKINDYVLVPNPDANLYRRRCQIINVTDNDKYLVYSEGLEEQEELPAEDLSLSKY